jgi:DNA phosphorothioation-dependent restriction protein DptG
LVNIDSEFISDLYTLNHIGSQDSKGEKNLKQLTSKNRKQLKTKMAEALTDKIETLPAGMQDILLDDLVTAFESRFEVLSNAQLNLVCFANIGVKIPNETL